jgi:hypothetical protein
MGNSSVAAVVAALLAVVTTALWCAAESPTGAMQQEWRLEESKLEGVQAAHTLSDA